MSLGFGTSGVRGLESDLTDEQCSAFARAFIRHFLNLRPESTRACVLAGDLRRSTPRIKAAITRGLAHEGFEVLDAGIVPTPALANECCSRQLPGIMVTGSHIPADRNGIKFYFPWGEILKPDEKPILELKETLLACGDSPAIRTRTIDAETNFIDRYLNFFSPSCLKGQRILFYEHSTAGRDLTPMILEKLGAEVIRFGRSESFIPVDTEALSSVAELGARVRDAKAFALVSADGDGDRPLLLDERGDVIRGDQIGILAAGSLHADCVSTPVSSSTALELSGRIPHIRRTKIGSPFVVTEMETAVREGKSRVVGFEGNGGFLLGSDIVSEKGKCLRKLVTRDSVLPVLLVLSECGRRNLPLSSLVAELPSRFTYSDLVRDFPTEKSKSLLNRLERGGAALLNRRWEPELGVVCDQNLTDGIRVSFSQGDILHFRPSGNAPEFRIYSESESEERARLINGLARAWILEDCRE